MKLLRNIKLAWYDEHDDFGPIGGRTFRERVRSTLSWTASDIAIRYGRRDECGCIWMLGGRWLYCIEHGLPDDEDL